jgi:hypothetical protein
MLTYLLLLSYAIKVFLTSKVLLSVISLDGLHLFIELLVIVWCYTDFTVKIIETGSYLLMNDFAHEVRTIGAFVESIEFVKIVHEKGCASS